jgi:hypothetical protein
LLFGDGPARALLELLPLLAAHPTNGVGVLCARPAHLFAG